MSVSYFKDAPPIVDHGNAPEMLATSIGVPERLPGDLRRFPLYIEGTDYDGKDCLRVVGYVVIPLTSIHGAVVIAMAELARSGLALLAEAGNVWPQ